MNRRGHLAPYVENDLASLEIYSKQSNINNMKILFIHQNFPGQYRHIVRALADQNCHQIVALGIGTLEEPIPKCTIFPVQLAGK